MQETIEPLNIPITVITGFLGSGKTTLLSSLIKSDKMANTAVIINEFGEVGLDHLLVEHSKENNSLGILGTTWHGKPFGSLDKIFLDFS